MINKFIGIGRLTRDLELRYTSSGKAVCNGSIAVDDGYGDNKKTEYINIVLWEKLAENYAKFTCKGSLVYVECRVKTLSYDSQEGMKKITEILVSEIKFLQTKKQEPAENFNIPDEKISTDDLPF